MELQLTPRSGLCTCEQDRRCDYTRANWSAGLQVIIWWNLVLVKWIWDALGDGLQTLIFPQTVYC